MAATYPDIVAEVRGRGLMIGIEIRPQLESPSPMIRLLSEQGLLTFLAAGHLLHEAGIRVAPTLSHHGTLRVEPSAFIGTAEIEALALGIRRFCELLRRADVARLWAFAIDEQPSLDLVRSDVASVAPASRHVPKPQRNFDHQTPRSLTENLATCRFVSPSSSTSEVAPTYGSSTGAFVVTASPRVNAISKGSVM